MLLTDSELDRLEAEVLKLLEDVGLAVKNEEITSLLLKRGCTPAASGRLLIPRELALEFAASQKQRAEASKQSAASQPPPEQGRASIDQNTMVVGDAFCPGPTRYYDFERGEAVDLTSEVVDGVMQFIDATPEVGGVHCWWPHDVPPEVESIVSLIRSVKLTRKVLGLDAINPKQIKYLLEISEILTGEPHSTRYLAGSQCMTPPLILGGRAAEEMLERRACGVPHYFVATMTMVGVSSPVTRFGSALSGAAEILGGMIAAHTVNREASITGGAYAVCMDMRGDLMTMVAPEMAWINAAIAEVFKHRLGGYVHTGTQYAPCAKVPGFQATYENYFLACASAQLEGRAPRYAGRGMIDSAAVGSPEQLMLDVEAVAALRSLHRPAVLDEDSLALEALREVIPQEGQTYLDHEHTVRHWRDRWTPQFFRWDIPGPGSPHGDGSERSILERVHQVCVDNKARYQPPDWPDDTLKALDDVERRAREELIGT